ncbi:hypothetical protein RRG08_039226 [Elysia crispata]|uniref:Uncharacterized protein n=1 Tax=Elysia crispata TaxID=231223 RepID=A0AAE1BDW2_9GAST|nr:hypothetical protein RRG08_039226 [Elysia crispata]
MYPNNRFSLIDGRSTVSMATDSIMLPELTWLSIPAGGGDTRAGSNPRKLRAGNGKSADGVTAMLDRQPQRKEAKYQKAQ